MVKRGLVRSFVTSQVLLWKSELALSEREVQERGGGNGMHDPVLRGESHLRGESQLRGDSHP
jgi:hypothetical protein